MVHSSMTAVVCRRHGPPESLELREVPKPVATGEQVLLRVCAASANPYDWHILRGKPYWARLVLLGLIAPRSHGLGADVAGRVEAVGDGVTRFRPGDEVFGVVGEIAQAHAGSFAEYVAVPERFLCPKPPNVTFEQAAVVPLAGLTALQGLRAGGRIQPGCRVLVNGASGGVGVLAVQIAKALGARVTAVCSARNVELLSSLGADDVIDYGAEDFTRRAERYDVLLDNVASQPVRACLRVLAPSGTYVLIGEASGGAWFSPFPRWIAMAVMAPFVSQRQVPLAARSSRADLEYLRELLASGDLRPVIDRAYALREVPAALSYLEAGHARGKVVIRLGSPAVAGAVVVQPLTLG